jgi:hypothetical protein
MAPHVVCTHLALGNRGWQRGNCCLVVSRQSSGQGRTLGSVKWLVDLRCWQDVKPHHLLCSRPSNSSSSRQPKLGIRRVDSTGCQDNTTRRQVSKSCRASPCASSPCFVGTGLPSATLKRLCIWCDYAEPKQPVRCYMQGLHRTLCGII